MQKVPTPGKKTCEEVAALLKLPLQRTVKSVVLAVDGDKEPQLYLLLIRGDHQLNEIKVNKIPGLAKFRFAAEGEIRARFSSPAGYLGPVGLKGVKIVADRTVAAMSDFVCGANEEGFHLAGVNFSRDIEEPQVADIRDVVEGDPSPDGKGKLQIVRGIEVGHIFQLRTKYSEAMKATFLDQAGKSQHFEMGCYGIGVTRIVGAAIEQGHDPAGIVFPAPIAPFEACIVPIGYAKSAAVREAADKLYAELAGAGVDVLLDDRDERPGVLFADMDLIGVPHRIVIGERGLAAGNAEYKGRRDEKPRDVPLAGAAALVRAQLKG
jgi:prolyl-tRNA synthetase